MAGPGSGLTGWTRGSHALLKDGARIVETADDILSELGWPAAGAALAGPRKSLISGPLVDRMLPGECYDLDALVELTGLAGPAILARLTELELAGIVAVSQGRYMRRS
jgi:DNA processing protein